MNKNALSKIMNDYEMLAYNEIISEINNSIKEAKDKKLDPLETYKLIRSKLEAVEDELTNLFAISMSTPLSEDVLSKIDEYIDPYATHAIEFVKEEVNKKLNNLNEEEYLDIYEYIKKM